VHRNHWLWAASAVAQLALLACGSPDGPPTSSGSGKGGSAAAGGGGGAGGNGGASATGGADNTGGNGNSGGFGTGGNTGGAGGIEPPKMPDAAADTRVNDDAPACSALVDENEVIVVTTVSPIDLYFLVDKSGSMLTADTLGSPTRWAALSSAIGTFVDASGSDAAAGGAGIGMGFFPITGPADGGRGGNSASSCNIADYGRASVDIAALPGNAAPIKGAIAATIPNGGTPTSPALQGAVQVATAYQAAHADRKVVIVLATDGLPNDCNSTVNGVAQVAASAFAQTPPLPIYVLGIGPSTGNLDAIAAAGGTRSAYMVTASGSDQLLQALNAIRTQTQTQTGTKIACSQKIPPSSSTRPLDYDAAAVTTTVGSTTLRPPRVAGAAACGTSDGWYFDDPATPTTVIFCPATCSALSPEAGKSRISVSIPCKPPPIEPPK
jgi:hypothetical protein